jgi:hypothetical protein
MSPYLDERPQAGLPCAAIEQARDEPALSVTAIKDLNIGSGSVNARLLPPSGTVFQPWMMSETRASNNNLLVIGDE